MNEKFCSECVHFRQHYVKFGTRYSAAGCGHCVYPRLKHRPPHTAACNKFRPKHDKFCAGK